MMTMMMTTNFSGMKKREEIRVSKFGSWGRNKGFWPGSGNQETLASLNSQDSGSS